MQTVSRSARHGSRCWSLPMPKPPIRDSEYPFVLITGRQQSHFGTGAMSRRAPGLVGLVAEARLEVNPEDAARLGVKQGDRVRVSSPGGSVEPVAWVTPRVPAGTVFLPIHFAEAAANVLVAPLEGRWPTGRPQPSKWRPWLRAGRSLDEADEPVCHWQGLLHLRFLAAGSASSDVPAGRRPLARGAVRCPRAARRVGVFADRPSVCIA